MYKTISKQKVKKILFITGNTAFNMLQMFVSKDDRFSCKTKYLNDVFDSCLN